MQKATGYTTGGFLQTLWRKDHQVQTAQVRFPLRMCSLPTGIDANAYVKVLGSAALGRC
jgi:hypothetical protein